MAKVNMMRTQMVDKNKRNINGKLLSLSRNENDTNPSQQHTTIAGMHNVSPYL